MTSKGAIKWLERLKEPRSIESLITEVYGEAAWFGCLFEREVADLLNFFEMARDSFGAITKRGFNTDDDTLSTLLKAVESRKILSAEQCDILNDGKEARNELV